MIMKIKFSFSIVLLIISTILLFVGFICQICSIASTFIALFVAIYEIIKSNKLEKKINSYDKVFKTTYDKKGDIEEITIDGGTY